MANEITGYLSDFGNTLPVVVATGSVVAGDFVNAYQTNTDDMFVSVGPNTFTTGSLAVQELAAANGDKVVGIALNDGSSGDTVPMAATGFFIAKAAGTVTAGFKVGTDAQGVIDAVDSASGAHYEVGRAITGASASGKFVALRLSV